MNRCRLCSGPVVAGVIANYFYCADNNCYLKHACTTVGCARSPWLGRMRDAVTGVCVNSACPSRVTKVLNKYATPWFRIGGSGSPPITPAAATKPVTFYGDPNAKPDEPETYEFEGHRMLTEKPECDVCGLVGAGPVKVAWMEMAVEKYVRNGVTYYSKTPPCDPEAKRRR